MKLATALSVVAYATALSGSSAATVVPYSGNVFVSQGAGFQQITASTRVRSGDAVMVSPDGLAQLHLDDGSVVTVSPGQVVSVPAKAAAAGRSSPPPAGTGEPGAAAPAARTSPLLPVSGAAAGRAAISSVQGAGTAMTGRAAVVSP